MKSFFFFVFFFYLLINKVYAGALHNIYERNQIAPCNSTIVSTITATSTIIKDVTVTELCDPLLSASIAQAAYLSVAQSTGIYTITSNNKVTVTHVTKAPATITINQFPTTIYRTNSLPTTVISIDSNGVKHTYIWNPTKSKDGSNSIKKNQKDSNGKYYVSDYETTVTASITRTITVTNQGGKLSSSETCIPIVRTFTSKKTIYFNSSQPTISQSKPASNNCAECVAIKVIKKVTLTGEECITTLYRTQISGITVTRSEVVTLPTTYTTTTTSYSISAPNNTTFSSLSTVYSTYSSSGSLPSSYTTYDSVTCSCSIVVIPVSPLPKITLFYTSSGPLPSPTTLFTTNSVGSSESIVVVYTKPPTLSTVSSTYTSTGPLPPPLTTIFTTNSAGSSTTIIVS